MPRQRFIWPTLWDDPDLGRVDPLAQLLYIGCFSLADDDGRLIGDPEFLRGAVFRYRHISPAKVRKLRDEVAAACSNFCVYQRDSKEYIVFLNWRNFQKPKYPRPSKLPEPFPESSRNVPGTLPKRSPIGLGWVGKDLKPGFTKGTSEPKPAHVWQENDQPPDLTKVLRKVPDAN